MHNVIDLRQSCSPADWRTARELIEEYAASLSVDLAFQNIAHELAHLEHEYAPPTGAFLLAVDHDQTLGCVGLRRFTDDTGEIKRLYVRPAARGRNLGRMLAERIVCIGAELGYARLVLDTLPGMQAAQALYASLGFAPIAAYRFNPVPGTAYLEKRLRRRG